MNVLQNKNRPIDVSKHKQCTVLKLQQVLVVRQMCEKLFPFGLQVSNLILLKIRALEIVIDVEPCEKLNFRNVCTFYMRK